jgi:hypothetical protein
VIVVLSRETIVRILDHAATVSDVASTSAAGPALSANVISALNKAKTDKANHVGPLEPNEFSALSAWCRSVGLTKDGELVEAAVRASG